MKAIEQYFHVALFIMLYKMCDHSNKSFYMYVLFQVLDTWKIIHMKGWWEIQEFCWYLRLVIIKK